MAKKYSLLLTILLMNFVSSCNSIDNELVDNTITHFCHYIEHDDLDSLSLLSNSVINNPELGIAIVNKINDSIPQAYEAALATMVFPQLAAKIMLKDFLSDSTSNHYRARKIVHNISSWYSLTGKACNIQAFKQAIDSCVETYNHIDKAKLYILASTPNQLGKILKQDTTTHKVLISTIDSIYNNSDLIEFNNALK